MSYYLRDDAGSKDKELTVHGFVAVITFVITHVIIFVITDVIILIDVAVI